MNTKVYTKITNDYLAKLKRIAHQAREQVLISACHSGSCHIASSLSPIDLLVALYFDILNINPKQPWLKHRDRLIFSKGHGGLGLYAVLVQRGFFSKKLLTNYAKDNTKLTVHPVRKSAPGLEATTGSLGHGLSLGAGLALAAKRSQQNWRTFVVMSDGECDEGSTWEAVMMAGQLKLDNLIAIVDYNKLQGFGRTKDVIDLEPFAAKWRAAHWATAEINGHNFKEILKALRSVPKNPGKPTVIIAHTVKGRGVPYMENKLAWHYLNIKPEDLTKTLKSLR